MDDVGELGGDVVLGAGRVLIDRRSDADWRCRHILPDEHLRSPFRWIDAQQLAVGIWDLLEEVEYSQRIEIVQSFPSMLLQLAVDLFSVGEGKIKDDLASGGLLLDCVGHVERSVFIVDDLQYRGLLHRPIDCLTVRTDSSFPALSVDLFAYLCSSEVVNVRSSQVLQEGPPLIFRQQNPSTVLDNVSVPPVAFPSCNPYLAYLL